MNLTTSSSAAARLTVLLPFALCTSGCSYHVYSPPARPVLLESAATLPKGDTGIQAEASSHLNTAVFDGHVYSGTLRVRRGVTDNLDASIEASVLHVSGDETARSVSREAYSTRGGAKLRLARHFSVLGGVGGGWSDGGAFMSPDLGAVVAFENRYVIPFLAGRGGVSVPVGARSIDISSIGDGPGTHVVSPRVTWLAGAPAGLKVPLGWAEHPEGTVRGALLAGYGLTHLADTVDSATFTQLSVGAEVVF